VCDELAEGREQRRVDETRRDRVDPDSQRGATSAAADVVNWTIAPSAAAYSGVGSAGLRP